MYFAKFTSISVLASLFVLLCFSNTHAQPSPDVGIVMDVSGACWVTREGVKDRMPMKKSMTLLPGDKLETEAGGRMKILLWAGDQRKTLSGNSSFVVPEVAAGEKKKVGIADAALGLLKDTYKGVAGSVVSTTTREAAIRGISVEAFFLLYPRNENIFPGEIEFQWTPLGSNRSYKFLLKENGKSVLEKETKENRLTVSHAFNPRSQYLWEVTAAAEGKAYRDSANFGVISEEGRAMIENELKAFEDAGDALSASQKRLLRPIVCSKWNMFSCAVREYIAVKNEPGVETDEIDALIKTEYLKMGFPDKESSFEEYLLRMGKE